MSEKHKLYLFVTDDRLRLTCCMQTKTTRSHRRHNCFSTPTFLSPVSTPCTTDHCTAGSNSPFTPTPATSPCEHFTRELVRVDPRVARTSWTKRTGSRTKGLPTILQSHCKFSLRCDVLWFKYRILRSFSIAY